MHLHYSVATLALAASSVLGQDCPPGYEKTNKITWVNCPVTNNTKLQCATLPVPLDYTQGTSGSKLNLRLVRQPAVSGGAQAKTIITNPGGPGISGINYIINGGSGIQSIVGENFHIVSFDPRGVGFTIPFTCPTLNAPQTYKNTDDYLQANFDSAVKQADECLKPRAGSDGDTLIGTAFVARDIKSIVDALGEDGLIRYYGGSYGTLLGSTLAAMFPDQIGRAVLDGNINPTDYYRGLGDEAIADFDKAIAHFFDLCAAAPAGPQGCPVGVSGQSGKQLLETFDNFLAKLSPEDSYDLRSSFGNALYGPELFVEFAEELAGYYQGTKKIPRSTVEKRDDPGFDPDASIANKDQTKQALVGITCGDWVIRPAGSVERFKEWLGIYKARSKYGGDTGLLDTLDQCSTWKIDAKEKFTGAFTGIKTKNPILFLNTQYDPVTPLVSAQNASSGFIGSKVLVSSAAGHCTSRDPSSALNEVVGIYFDTGFIPTDNVVYQPDVANVFAAPRAPKAAARKKRAVEYPDFFRDTADVGKRQDPIPASCTKIASSSSSLSLSSSVSSSISSASSVLSSSSAVPSSSSSVGAVSSSSASNTASSSVLSSSVSSASSPASNTRPTSAVSSSSSPASGSSSIASSSSSVAGGSGSSSVSSANSASSVSSGSSGSSSATGSPVSGSLASSSPSVSRSPSSSSAATTPGAGTPVVTPSASGPSTTMSPSNQTAPSQSGVMNITRTLTTTTVRTITKCPETVTNCPVGSVTTETRTRTTVVPVSTTTAASSQTPPSQPSFIGITKTITTTTVRTITKCPETVTNCPVGSVTTETRTRTTVVPASTTPAPSSQTSPSQSGSIGITKTITTTTVRTITKCPETVTNCPVGSVTTETQTRTTVVPVPTTTVVSPGSQSSSAQSGFINITRTITTTAVQTITKCPETVTNCPVGSVTTQTQTRTTVVPVPTTTVYVTTVVDVCPTGLTTSTATITATCNAGCTTPPTQGFTTITTFCTACATPSTVTITIPVSTAPVSVWSATSAPGRVSSQVGASSVASSRTRASSRASSAPGVQQSISASQIVSQPTGGPPALASSSSTAAAVSSPAPGVPPPAPSASIATTTRPLSNTTTITTGSTPAQFTGGAPSTAFSFVSLAAAALCASSFVFFL